MTLDSVLAFALHRDMPSAAETQPVLQALADTLICTAVSCSLNLALLCQVLVSLLEYRSVRRAGPFRVEMGVMLASTFVVLLGSNAASMLGIFNAVHWGDDALPRVQIADGIAAVGYRLVLILSDYFCIAAVVWLLRERRRQHAIDPSKARLHNTDILLTIVMPGMLIAARAAVFGFDAVALLGCRALQRSEGVVELPSACEKLSGLENLGVMLGLVQCIYTSTSLWHLRKRDSHRFDWPNLSLFGSALACRVIMHSVFLLGEYNSSVSRPFDTLKLFRLGDAESAIILAYALHHLIAPDSSCFELCESFTRITATNPVPPFTSPPLTSPAFSSPSFRTEDSSYFSYNPSTLQIFSPTFKRT
ncbi:hypothetical protein OC842_000510 [Tilletia horrida]|uniref:Uncharacterized protein n=1 Tax=Tilletia horrida TaxID=155126 RepID=A0AAN6JMQ9_9BASI|nr:hypothetical protein OC842_000510 [Tilletia horrida]